MLSVVPQLFSFCIFQAICNHADDIRFTFLQKMEVDYKLLAITVSGCHSMGSFIIP